MNKVVAVAKSVVGQVVDTIILVVSAVDGLSLKQRKTIYKALGALLATVAVALGIDAHTTGQWIETVTVAISVFGPLLAHLKATE